MSELTVAQGTNLTTQSEQALPPQWLTGWKPEYPVPATLEEVDVALVNAERALTPISLIALGRGLDVCLRTWRVPKDHDVAAAMEAHLDVLSDLPEDLVELAFSRARKTLKFFPVPAEIRSLVASEFSARRHTLSRLKAARGKAAHEQALERQRQERAPAKAAEVREIGERLRAMSDGVVARTKAMKGGAMRAAQ